MSDELLGENLKFDKYQMTGKGKAKDDLLGTIQQLQEENKKLKEKLKVESGAVLLMRKTVIERNEKIEQLEQEKQDFIVESLIMVRNRNKGREELEELINKYK